MQHIQQKVLRELRTLLSSHERLLKDILNLEFDSLSQEEDSTLLVHPNYDMPSGGVGIMPRGVKLPPKVYDRFEQLRDRMVGSSLYGIKRPHNSNREPLLNETSRLLRELDVLSDTVKSVTVGREWLQKEKSARITGLSSKLWLFFLPIFMVTAIFSVKIPSVAGHEKTYSITLGVVGALSFLTLFVHRAIGGE